MYHATNQTVEYKETGREAQRALVRELGNLKCGGALLKDYCTRFFITPLTVKLGVFKRPMSPFTAEVSFIRLALLKYIYKAVCIFLHIEIKVQKPWKTRVRKHMILGI